MVLIYIIACTPTFHFSAPLSTGSGVLESGLRFSLRNKRRKKEEDDESNAQQLSEEDKKIPEALSKEDKIKLHNAREVERRTELRQLGKKLLTVATENVLPQDRPQGRSIATLAILNVVINSIFHLFVFFFFFPF